MWRCKNACVFLRVPFVGFLCWQVPGCRYCLQCDLVIILHTSLLAVLYASGTQYRVFYTCAGSVVRSGTPPLGALGGKPPKSKSNALLSKLGNKAGPGAGRPTASKTVQPRSKEPPPAAAIEGAKHSVAVCLLGLISERDFRRLVSPSQVP